MGCCIVRGEDILFRRLEGDYIKTLYLREALEVQIQTFNLVIWFNGPRNIKKQTYYFANKGPSSKAMVFPVVMYVLSPPPPPSRPGLSPPACPGWLGQRSGLAAGQSSSAITTEADLPLGGPGVRARSRTAMCPGSRVTLDGRRADLPPGLGCAWQTQARAGEPDF